MTIRILLESGLPDLIRRVERGSLNQLEQGFNTWDTARNLRMPDAAEEPLAYRALHYLQFEIDERLESVYFLRSARVEFENRYAHEIGETNRHQHVLDFAAQLGASRRQLFADRLAFKRWFGRDAVLDRFERQLGATEQFLHFILRRLGALAAAFLAEQADDDARNEMFRRLGPDKKLEPLLTHDGDVRIQNAAFDALAAILAELPVSNREFIIKANVLRYIYRCALDYAHDVWLQCEALKLLQHLSAESFATSIRTRLTNPRPGDDFFVRRRAVLLAGSNVRRLPELQDLFEFCLNDPSPFVRQGLAQAIWALDAAQASVLFERIVKHDPVPNVRAAALLELPSRLVSSAIVDRLGGVLTDVLACETDPYVIRVAIRTSIECHGALVRDNWADAAAQWRGAMMPALERLHRHGEPLGVRRWAARARERLWCHGDDERADALEALTALAREIVPGGSARVSPKACRDMDAGTLARIASLVAEDDYSLSFNVRSGRATMLYRGERFGLRVWRWLHELRHGATDKRQAFSHTVGRLFRGTYRAPAGYLAEQTETRVPGEPVYIEEEDGWRPYLPLVDEAISCIDEEIGAATIFLYTAEGVTELTAPATFTQRLYARAVLTWRFAYFARLRNWRGGGGSPTAYLRALEKLGFRIHFKAHGDAGEQWSEDPDVARFFPATLGVAYPGLFADLKQYFFSVYENTIYELAFFLAAVAGIVLGRHALISRATRRARRRLPLVIGGWGTRGKSGTERMKAALFAAMGYSVVSKTTGTEAMFLQSRRFGGLGEMFLFRPYDKATIWEQVNVLRYGADSGADFFLWECMGLTPSYVSVLAQDWMKDDIATITNTYPDHEDLQGPAGINIPEVMTEFIPHNATLITSEQHMLPILRDAATRRNTDTIAVGWLETGLVSEDVLARFPYDEHPANIALILAMSRQLGIAEDFALKEIADYVVPDLGVLKSFPAAQLDSCTLEFVNGMAANERLGFMGNWNRIGFAEHDVDADPGTWITTLVNNRADRVPRSRVFADILVRDIQADRHYLIGSNLHGFMGYLEESWTSYAVDYTLEGSSEYAGDWSEKFIADARNRRICVDESHLLAQLHVMFGGINVETDENRLRASLNDREVIAELLSGAGREDLIERVTAHLDVITAEHYACREFVAALRAAQAGGESVEDWNERATELLWQWLLSRIVLIEGVEIEGDNIIRHIAASTPPGYHNWILGCQNIKGPGLDFVYRWQAWENCNRACDDLCSGDPVRTERGLNALVSFQEFGPLSEHFATQAIAATRQTEIAQSESFESRLRLVEHNLTDQLATNGSLISTARASRPLLRIVGMIEAFFDAGDAVRRRKRADRIYRDLVTMRISRERAIVELQKLNKRQKGGWMSQRVEQIFSRH